MEFLCRELSRCLTERKEQGSVVIEGVFQKWCQCVQHMGVNLWHKRERERERWAQ